MTGKSAEPDSSNINPSSSNNAAPSSSQGTGTSFDLPITPQANAHPAQVEISEVGSSSSSDSPSLAHAGRDRVSEIGSPSTPSAPSPRKRRVHAKRLRETAEQHNKLIREVTEGLNEESGLDHLLAFFDQISQLSDLIKKEKQDKEEKKIKEKEKKKEKKKKTGGKKKGEEKENNPSEPKRPITSWLSKENLLKLKEVLYEAVSAAKDFTSSGDAKKMARGLIRDIGGGHAFNIVFIVVADVWQRYVDMSDDEKECLSLLEEINEFAKHVLYLKRVLQNGSASKEMLEDEVKKAIELIIETCIACSNHIEASKKRRYFKRTEYGAELAKYVKKLKKAYPSIQFPLSIGIYEEQLRSRHPEFSKDADYPEDPKDAVETNKPVQLRKPDYPECSKDADTVTTVGTKQPVQLRKPDYPEYPEDAVETNRPVQLRKPDYPECSKDAVGTKQPVQLRKPDYPEYPKDAVGIEDPLREVIERLEMASDRKAVAVVVHGFGGMGKTTLANAVFAELFEKKTEGFKFSFVELFKDRETPPNIVESQKFILRDLKGDEPDEIRSYRGGQKQIESMLEKEETFIYIDNVLLPADTREKGQDALIRLLPENMANAKKLRLLITTRETDAATMTMCKGVEKQLYPIESLPEPKAVELLKKELHDNDNGNQLDASQIDGIVKICGGVPGLLKVLAGFINGGEGSAVQNYETLMKEAKEKNWKGDIGESIEKYVFAYDKLEDKLKDPFLDICSFFRGWDWKELSDIVGETELKRLEQRALVTQDVKSMTARVHDVILEVGLTRTKGNRFRLTTATEIEEFLNIEDEDLQKIKGIWASDNEGPLHIPASNLDLMSRSLRVLKLGRLTDVEGKCKNTFKELVFFSAITSHLPFDLSKLKMFKNLRHLCYNPKDLQNLLQMPSSLGHIEFQLNSVPFHISSTCIKQLSNLRVLRLANAQFKSLPQELGDLGNRLEELSFSGCQNLTELPASISRLGYLRVLRMDGCSGLTQLPKGLGSLTSLQELYLYGCKSLEALPSELENLTSLQKLNLSWCKSLKELPSTLGKLRSLQELHLYSCNSLQPLPPSLEELSLLRLLDLSHCYRIGDLRCGFEKLTSLVELNLYCCGLSSIPGSIGKLKLNSIDLNSASLKDLPDGFCDFSTLTELDMTDCDSLEELPARFGEVTSLRKLIMTSCGRLRKLPKSFNQLKYLEHLDLSRCSTLEELCKDFKGLSRLRVLSLEGCHNLKNLPEDFQCLTSLEVLDVRNCHKLEGKWIDSMLKMEKLQILRIAGSKLLEERWEKIQAQQCNQSWSCVVHTEQGLSNEENLLKQFQSEFDSMLTHGEREPLNISGLPLHTLLLVMFDGQQEFRPHFPLPLLEESIDDIETHFAMVYFGNHFKKLPEKVADRILGHAPANGHAKALFQKLLSLVVHYQTDFDFYVTSSFQMTAEVVSGEKGDKYLSRWKFFGVGPEDEKMVEDFVVTKCGRYVKLKQLAERPGGSPIALLTELFPRREEEISLSFLKNKDGEFTTVGVDELKGKTILLDIRPANICFDIPLHALVEMYNVEKEKFGFEIITIPLMQENTKSDVSLEFSREVPWLVLQNPWQLTNATKYFLVDNWRPQWNQEWDRWYPNPMRIIKSDGTIAPYKNPGVLHMVNTWGAAAYPFTAEKEEELIQKEKTQMELMSDGMFLFQHLERVAEQLREATGQQKMICLWCCHEKEFTNSMKDVLTELSDIIYIIYIPNFHRGGGVKFGYFTATIYKSYYVEPSKMSSAEMGRIFSLSLSEYEAIRFWARIYSLKEIINFTDQFQLSEMLSRATDGNSSWMFIMDEDGNLITKEGKEIVKLLSEKYSDDRVKELMQQLIKGTKNSWKETLSKLQKMSHIDSEDSEGDLEEFDIEDSEVDLEESDDVESQGNLSEELCSDDAEESDDVESQGNLSEELCSDDADRDSDDGDREGDDVFQEN